MWTWWPAPAGPRPRAEPSPTASIAAGTRTYEELLDEARPDFVTIATPSGFHLEPLEACARRGIHVLCEKPLEISVTRVDRMIQVARESGIRLGGIFPQRFNPVLREVHGAASQGRFGDLAVVNAYVPWWRDDAYYAPDRWQGTLALDGGGAMMNQSIHGVDAAQWLASAAIPGLPPEANPVRGDLRLHRQAGSRSGPDRGGGTRRSPSCGFATAPWVSFWGPPPCSPVP